MSDITPLDYEQFADEMINSFGKEVQKELGLICNATGGSMPNDIEGLTVGFLAYRSATIEEARELEVILIEKFLKTINAHEKIRPFLRDYPFTSHRVSISIEFIDKKFSLQNINKVTDVFSTKNGIYYDFYDEDKQAFIEIRKESYEEAYQKVRGKLTDPPL